MRYLPSRRPLDYGAHTKIRPSRRPPLPHSKQSPGLANREAVDVVHGSREPPAGTCAVRERRHVRPPHVAAEPQLVSHAAEITRVDGRVHDAIARFSARPSRVSVGISGRRRVCCERRGVCGAPRLYCSCGEEARMIQRSFSARIGATEQHETRVSRGRKPWLSAWALSIGVALSGSDGAALVPADERREPPTDQCRESSDCPTGSTCERVWHCRRRARPDPWAEAPPNARASDPAEPPARCAGDATLVSVCVPRRRPEWPRRSSGEALTEGLAPGSLVPIAPRQPRPSTGCSVGGLGRRACSASMVVGACAFVVSWRRCRSRRRRVHNR
jgi:hypothetical protein